MKKILFLCAIILVAGFLCVTQASTAAWNAGDIVGHWRGDKGNMIIEIVKSSDKYLVKNEREDSITSAVGDVTGELSFNGTNSTWTYTGKHVWGGTKRDQHYWGKEGGLVVKVIDYNTINVVYLDSKYGGGWVLRRVR